MTDRRPELLATPVLLALACLCAPAAADEPSPWYVGASQAFISDSNLYRLAGDPPAGFSRDDLISVTSLVGGLDQPIGRQRLFGSLKIDNNRYNENDYLNDNSYAVSGGLDWSTAERFSGRLSLAGSERQKKFNTDTSTPQNPETAKNLERVNQLDAVFRLGNVTRLSFDAGLGYRALDYSAPQYAGEEYEQARGSLGVRYRPGIATFGAALSVADTTYNNPVNDSQRTSVDFTAFWPGTGASSLYVRLSPTRIDYDQFSERDFDGLTGSLRWNWIPTGKITVETRLVHDIGQDSGFEAFGGPPSSDNVSTTGRTTTDLRVAAAYQLSAKIALDSALSSSHRSLEQVLPGSGFLLRTGEDDTVLFTLGARWTPLRSVQVGCSVGLDQRWAEGSFSQDYTSRSINCFGQFTLQ